MLEAYHLATEREKGRPVDDVDRLPATYRAEIADARPASGALQRAGRRRSGGRHVRPGPDLRSGDRGTGEVTRLWVEPDRRGRGLGQLAIHDAVRRAGDVGVDTVRLSVWEWRTGAIGLYRRAGFVDCPSWDPRPGLVCLERRAG